MTEQRKHVSHSSAVVICLYISVSFLFVRRNCIVPVLTIDFFFLFRLVNPSSCNTNCSELLEFSMFWSAYLFPFDLCCPAHWYWSLLLIFIEFYFHYLCIIFAILLLTFVFALFCWGQKKPIRCLFSDVSGCQLRCIKGARQVHFHHCVSVEWVHVFLLRGGRVPARTTEALILVWRFASTWLLHIDWGSSGCWVSFLNV